MEACFYHKIKNKTVNCDFWSHNSKVPIKRSHNYAGRKIRSASY